LLEPLHEPELLGVDLPLVLYRDVDGNEISFGGAAADGEA
jgi:hypothetical protein